MRSHARNSVIDGDLAPSPHERRSHTLVGVFTVSLWLLWQAIRLPVVTFLVILEPIANFILSALALLATLTAIFWEWVHPKGFPFFTLLVFALGCVALLALYHALIRLLSGAR